MLFVQFQRQTNTPMRYTDLFHRLRHALDATRDSLYVPDLDLRIHKRPFVSSGTAILPGAERYACDEHEHSFASEHVSSDHPSEDSLHVPDAHIGGNEKFCYIFLQPGNGEPCKDVIFLFHGLNEKKWNKYLPWAYHLLKETGKGVILFPIAFHMDRAPAEWSAPGVMHALAEQRKKTYTSNSAGSFVNVAISTRLEANPQRFFWSGLQTYMDFSALVKNIRRGKCEGVASDARIDLFGYSIGAFFSLILLMADPQDALSNSRLFLFCGGATLDRMYPVSRYIMDSRSANAVHTFYSEQLNNGFALEKRLAHYIGDGHRRESYFKTMLNYHHFKPQREKRIREIRERMFAVALLKDDVVPPAEVLNTLKGDFRDLDTPVDVLDFSHPYSHINPFPLTEKHAEATDIAFRRVMDKAAGFLQKR